MVDGTWGSSCGCAVKHAPSGAAPVCEATACPADHSCYTHGAGIAAQSWCCDSCNGVDVSDASKLLMPGANRCPGGGASESAACGMQGAWPAVCTAASVPVAEKQCELATCHY